MCKSTSEILIACVGDSITAGSHASDKRRTSYPARLQTLLTACSKDTGTNFTTINFGKGGTTVSKTGTGDDHTRDMSYWTAKEYQGALKSNADIVIIGFGTNDAKAHNWKGESLFISDYSELIQSFKSLPEEPVIYLSIPPPIYLPFLNVRDDIIKTTLPQLIVEIAKKNQVHVIDVFTALGGVQLSYPDLFLDPNREIKWPNDGCHPNDKGYMKIAQTVAKEIILDQKLKCILAI